MKENIQGQPGIKDLDFMFAGELTWNDTEIFYRGSLHDRSISDIEDILENEFPNEGTLPQATFKPDLSAEKWKKTANFDEITNYVSDCAKYLADPEEHVYIEIPFSDSFKENIRNQFQMDAGLDLLRSSRSMRDYFRYWSDYQAALVAESSLVRPKINANLNYGCSGILALFVLLFIFTGLRTNNMEGAIPIAVLLGGGIFFLVKKGKQSVVRRSEEFDDKAKDAKTFLEKSQKKLLGFLERNTWFPGALAQVIAAADESAEKFIMEQEIILGKRREKNKFVDAPDDYLPETSVNGGLVKATPKKMERFSPRDYEVFCAGWVEFLGGKNVRVTQQSSDGGIDIVSENEVAQVKLHGSPVSVQPIRELFGVSQSLSKTPLFFTSTGYTQAAITFAEANDIFLFIADPVTEDLKGVTEISRALKHTGLTLNSSSE